VLTDGWMKLFTVFYLLIGIGILVEILRRLGFAFVTVRAEEKKAAKDSASRHGAGVSRSPDDRGDMSGM
jgi:hypothetical protein